MGVNPGDRPSAPSVHVEIGELVLDGFPGMDADLVVGAFERELRRLVRERGVGRVPDGEWTVDLVSGLPPLPTTSSPRRLGTALARSVYKGLTRRDGGGRR
ncbi:hypothetical protein LX15_002852 [Streptoalloteichus tenebrarius]|uniref:Uncharacterized protein n=1 Tax=Streptoalloteichus tenebrarius (strain ATCC 17920 / DSM 40477 / JCM 4838 / CBS 697.72 / NBRC 16177 / NCIMB 11028 / NRRL B-12390 / A12253. 1 / ISP 5477) TaxID=1933 RepID=A0ABT1HUE8_STRSD|nr:hypothetical protein [Streptoalloteichus tenebrarius]MCP2259151.1 hypothetical protein [Streptoalloteichus tenebrarius]BFF04372.1 hypothetical protein GCM10020241_60470 [Streptoalloteichus tenebrarius]